MKLIFLNRFFYPDHSATSQMLSDLAFGLAEQGQNVAVITSRQRYDAPTVELAASQIINHVTVHRVWTSRFGRANLPGRAVDYATFYLSAAWRLWRVVEIGDVVVAKTDPPMVSVVAIPVCWLRRARLINWLQDIFPEAAEALGVGGRLARAPFGLMRWLRNRSLKTAHMNVVLGERMAECLRAMGIASDRIRVIPNWADGTAIAPIEHAVNPLRTEWELGEAFVVAYSGNLGRVHETETMLNAIAAVEERTDRESLPAVSGSRRPICWLFIGSGALFDPFKAEVARRRLASVHFKPYQERALLAQSLSAADVHLVSLRPELEGLVVPSKFYGIAAAGRPSIFIGDPDGEIARILRRIDGGLTVPQGDSARLAQIVLELASDPLRCRELGDNARRAFAQEFDKALAMKRWQTVMGDVVQDP